MALSENIEEMEFDWVQLHQDMEKYAKTETSQEKLMRKLKQNPVVPIGKNKVITKRNTTKMYF